MLIPKTKPFHQPFKRHSQIDCDTVKEWESVNLLLVYTKHSLIDIAKVLVVCKKKAFGGSSIQVCRGQRINWKACY